MPMVLTPDSSSFGQNIMTSAPTSGRNVPTVSSQLLSVSVSMRLVVVLSAHVEDDEDDGANSCSTEQKGAVLVDLAGLHRLQTVTGF